MALISCPECEKEISDKAISCPGCGCPLSEIVRPTTVMVEELNNITSETKDKNKLNNIQVVEKDNLCQRCGDEVVDIFVIKCKSCGMLRPLAGKNILKKEILLSKAIDMQLNYKNDNVNLKNAVNMYKYIIDNYGRIEETYYAISNLQILHDDLKSDDKLKSEINEILIENYNKIKYINYYRNYNSNYNCKKCSTEKKLIKISRNILFCEICKESFELRCDNSKKNDTINNGNIDDEYLNKIPIAIYIITGIIGFPLAAGLVFGCYIKQKNFIKNREYEKFEKNMLVTKITCISFSTGMLANIIYFIIMIYPFMRPFLSM